MITFVVEQENERDNVMSAIEEEKNSNSMKSVKKLLTFKCNLSFFLFASFFSSISLHPETVRSVNRSSKVQRKKMMMMMMKKK